MVDTYTQHLLFIPNGNLATRTTVQSMVFIFARCTYHIVDKQEGLSSTA
jgi:hypothetical protein